MKVFKVTMLLIMATGRDIHLTTGCEIAVDDFDMKHEESGLSYATIYRAMYAGMFNAIPLSH